MKLIILNLVCFCAQFTSHSVYAETYVTFEDTIEEEVEETNPRDEMAYEKVIVSFRDNMQKIAEILIRSREYTNPRKIDIKRINIKFQRSSQNVNETFLEIETDLINNLKFCDTRKCVMKLKLLQEHLLPFKKKILKGKARKMKKTNSYLKILLEDSLNQMEDMEIDYHFDPLSWTYSEMLKQFILFNDQLSTADEFWERVLGGNIRFHRIKHSYDKIQIRTMNHQASSYGSFKSWVEDMTYQKLNIIHQVSGLHNQSGYEKINPKEFGHKITLECRTFTHKMTNGGTVHFGIGVKTGYECIDSKTGLFYNLNGLDIGPSFGGGVAWKTKIKIYSLKAISPTGFWFGLSTQMKLGAGFDGSVLIGKYGSMAFIISGGAGDEFGATIQGIRISKRKTVK